jgi:RNA methyltransferase, TrmH family
MITSRDNEKLKLVRKLHERRWRDKLGLFFVEGEDAVEAATAEPVELLVAGGNVEAALLAEVSTAAHPPRVIAVYRRDDLPGGDTRSVALELHGVADPGNLGTLVRTADAFGAAVVLAPGCADPTGPKALRASAGSIWRVPIVVAGQRVSVLTREEKRVALVAHGGAPLAELELYGEVTFLLGAERTGLPAEAPRDLEASIPIAGAESLNVAAAGAIALYEWRRQNP